jgi:Flp pilus assembly protein TadD
LAALRAASPDGERDGIVTDSRAVLRHSIGSFVALLLWVAAIAGAVWLGQDQESISLALSILLGISISPILILLASIRKKLAVSSRRQGTSIRLVMLVYLVLLFLVVFAISPKDVDGRSVLPVVVLLILLVLILVPLLKWIQRPQADIVAAIREHDFQRAVELGEENPKRVRKDQNLRHNVAMARALCGDRQRAIDEMRQLVHDVPKFQQAALTLATFLLDEDPAEAMEVADRAAKKLKRDSGPLVIRARALRRLGRLQEADDVIGRAIELAPDDGTILAVAAQISLDLGDIERATELMDEAQRKTPGDAFCLMVRAELALASGTMEEAVDAVEKAAAAAGHNPLALLGGEIARLRRHPAVASRWGEADEVIWAEDAEER